MADANLHASLLQCRYYGVAHSRRRTYHSGLTKFQSFCHQYNLTALPASCLTLQYFCVHEAQRISYNTIKVYLAAICLRHIEHGFHDPTTDNLLWLVCRGIRRRQGDNQRARQPITLNILRILKEKLCQSTYTFTEKLMLWAAFTMEFYGFMHVSEYVNLCWRDISCSEDCISIFLHQLKTDPFRHGHTIHIFKTNSSTCPHSAFNRYRNSVSGINTSLDAPVYQAGRFSPLSRAMITRTICQLLSQDHMAYASHSFRIGDATTAAVAGLPAWIIKSLGRWSSNAYLSYIHRQPNLTTAIHQLLSRTDASNQLPWNPDTSN